MKSKLYKKYISWKKIYTHSRYKFYDLIKLIDLNRNFKLIWAEQTN